LDRGRRGLLVRRDDLGDVHAHELHGLGAGDDHRGEQRRERGRDLVEHGARVERRVPHGRVDGDQRGDGVHDGLADPGVSVQRVRDDGGHRRVGQQPRDLVRGDVELRRRRERGERCAQR
ncbi:MAG: hypothetical protein ACK56I_10105, partial [bacterium]